MADGVPLRKGLPVSVISEEFLTLLEADYTRRHFRNWPADFLQKGYMVDHFAESIRPPAYSRRMRHGPQRVEGLNPIT